MREIEFDPAKNEGNIAKHGISLDRAGELHILATIRDNRFEEVRYRLYGVIDGLGYCLAATYRDGRVRAISLRRAHKKEMDRYVKSTG